MNSHLKSRLSLFPFRCWPFAAPLLAIFLLSSSAPALLMRENGPEPIIIQIKESLRLSDELNNRLSQLEAMRSQNGLGVLKWYAGNKLIVMLSFPSNFTERQASGVIEKLQQSPAVEKVVPVSASNLEFKPPDFAREFLSHLAMPEAARRGLDKDELSHPAMTQAQIDEAAQMPHVPNQMIVRWKSKHVWRASTAGFLQSIANFHAAAGAHVLREMRPSPSDLLQVIEFNGPGTSLAGKLRQYADCPWVDYAQPNYTYTPARVPNDTFYTNPGQPALPRIKAPEAWDITTGNHDVVIAVADSGANIFHPDFMHRLAAGRRNFVAVPPNDDVHEDDIFQGFHGSNVAGIIGAEGNNRDVMGSNGGYMAGVAWDVSLLILKVSDHVGIGSTERWISAIDYAYSPNGNPPAIAINCSFGNPRSSTIDKALAEAVERARNNNMVVVAAAGNSGLDSDLPNNLISPASIPKDNVIAVGATRVRPDIPARDDTKADYSNKGIYRVELGAPGGEDPAGGPNSPFGMLGLSQHILNGNPPFDPAYTKFSGTSQAAPHVTGALALVKSRYPWEDYLGIRDRVIMGTDDVEALHDQFRTGGRLNLFKALQKRTLIRNFSARARVESGDRIIVGGFTIGGSAGPCGPAPLAPCLKVAIRALGPSMPELKVPRLSDPKLQLNSLQGLPMINNDWQDDPAQAAELTALGLAPGDPQEAAMVKTLSPGSYTIFVQSQDGQPGVGLLEIYEISDNTSEKMRLRNVSARCPVGVGDEVVNVGTIVGDPNGSADVPKRRLLMRGRGPSLAYFGVPGVLADPQLELHDSTGALMTSNGQWRDVDGPAPSTGLEDKLIDSGFAPQCFSDRPDPCENESVLWPTLARGVYTTVLQGANNGTGIGMVEFFEY